MLDDQQRQLRETAREFAVRELEPHAERWDRAREFPREAVRQLAELGFFGLLVPESEGGSGFDTLGFCLAVEEISRAVPALGLLLSIHNGPVCHLVHTAGAPAARDRWLPRVAAGEVLGAFALSEAHAGSDATAIATRYRSAGNGGGAFVLEGIKQWVTGAGVAGMAVVCARREDGGASACSLTAFVVDLASAGVQVGPVEETMGLRAVPVAPLMLEGVEVAPEDLLGSEGSGWRLVLEALALGRLGVAAQSLGIAGRCIDSAVSYAGERRQFGRPVAEFQGVRLPLADLAARLEAARALVYLAAAERDAGGADFVTRAAMAKLVASELAMAAALQAVQVYGGYGYIKDYPVERFFRDAKACQICEGTNEIQRVVIAKHLFGS